MISVEDAVICRVKKAGCTFEILVDPDKALEFRETKNINLDEILAISGIYRDARKGDLVSNEELQQAFRTVNTNEVIKKILLEGELQFTTQQRRKMVEEKRNQIANIISKKAINPQTNTPHPVSRILNAMDQVGVRIDPFLNAESQVDGVIKSIKTLLPIKLQRVIFRITIPSQFTGKVYSLLKKSVDEFEEKWLGDGSLQAVINVPIGIQMDLLKMIGDATYGNFKSEIIKIEDV